MIVSIISVCFNSEKSIEKTILSVINQDYDQIEYIIIDGKSTDSTLEIITKHQSKIHHWVSESDNGIYDAMNKGIKKATGEIIYFLNSDDFFTHNCVISEVVKKFQNNTNIDLLYGKIYRYTSSNAKLIFDVELSNQNLLRAKMPSHQAVFVKKSVFEKIGHFDLNFKSAADFDFLCKIIRHKFLIERTDDIIAYYSIEGYSNYSNKGLIETMKIIKKYFGPYPYVLSIFRFAPIILFRYIATKLRFMKFYRTKIYPRILKMK